MRLRDRLRPAATTQEAGAGAASPLAGLDLLERRITPPNALGRGPLIDEPGFGVAIVAIVKNEGRYLEEWLSYHAALGVDHVFLYDNRSTDDSADLLEPWIDHGLVTRLDWPQQAGQVAAYNHALRMFGRVAEWLLYVDPDEYLVPLVDDDIPSLLARFSQASDVRFPRREFAFSGHREPPPGLTIESYTQVADVFGRGEDASARVKTAMRPPAVAAMTVHLAVLAAEDRVAEGLATVEPEALSGIAQVNHYYTRSFAEYERKRAGSSASGRHERPELQLDLPTLATDEAATRFVERTIAFRDAMRSLDPQPQRYGSRLRLAHFPRANDVGRYGERLVTDVAEGLDDLTGAGRVRIRNVHPGIGFVGDLGKAGRRPVPAALSGSLHLEALLVTLCARLEAAAIPRDGSPIELGPGASSEFVTVDVDPPERRRVYLVGFIAEVGSSATFELTLAHDDVRASAPAVIPLKRASTWVGLIEVDEEPRTGRRVQARLTTDAPARLFDLFVLSHG